MTEDSRNHTKKAEVVELLKRLEEGSVPDEEIRRLMRIQLGRRLQWGYKPTYQQQLQENLNLVHSLRQMGIATESAELDSQLYEVPISFLELIHGKKVKQRLLQLSNVEIVLANIISHEMEATFDRIMVVALFEHMKNYELLLKKISNWMAHDGLLFVEILCHKIFAYLYEDDVSVTDQWILSGRHLACSMEGWLNNLDANMDALKEIAVIHRM